MRHKYETRGIVLSLAPLGEANASVVLVTQDLGLVRARAQGVRKSGAKLAAALTTFAESGLVLVRGKEGWRVAGAILEEHWFTRLRQTESLSQASRVCRLVLRLAADETHDGTLYRVMRAFFTALATLPEDMHEAAEVFAVLQVLAALGLDAGEFPRGASAFTQDMLAEVAKDRATYIARINHGIEASGL